ncbi:alpha/beta hydrolase family esterase [Pseudobacteriovorax antillogorgiicola]|uniref:Polyhydroxybutyrate depolymerase n=1 Tax=Pseudobacteriovorax antillogorgiicola TaxID=1513793 RepID=A0A1Y6C2A1_9BACT|nr:PHB depolymerase family esterase [Pseudobacteriovorax antillogorgiicola]TCS51142.1 polyhydroxybutyrate depolymerase [Pseudobacteriovorax antillogorgiicola]SMF38353.1 polyhydroxybutyrate depolymerase [Pseudobacteriovorax antillogorgiicola]
MKLLLTFVPAMMVSTLCFGVFKQTKTVGPADRPAELKLPRFYKESKQYPLVVLLHGRGNSASLTDLYLGLSRNQDQLGYALLLPNGTDRLSDGQKVWNATAECCADNPDSDINDSRYLVGLIEEVKASYSINADQVFVMGHSNGGFMSYRLACDTNGLIKGIVSVAGSTFASADQCLTETPINVLQIHGVDDSIVPYDAEGKDYPAAPDTAQRWADRNQCQQVQENLLAQNLLLLTAEPGSDENGNISIDGNLFELSFKAETDEVIYSQCADDTKVGLWSINGADHAPVFIGRNVIRKALEFVGYQK